MLSALFLLALSAATPEAVADQAILDAFRAACARPESVEHMRADALASGWDEISEDADARVASLMQAGRTMIEPGWSLSGAAFRRSVEGVPLFLIVSRAQDDSGIWGSGCRLYHFEATQRVSPELVNNWMGRTPTGTEEAAAGHSKMLWEPGWRDGVTIEVNHVPQESPFRERYGLSGNIFVAQVIGGF
jgi:hypothetical protein